MNIAILVKDDRVRLGIENTVNEYMRAENSGNATTYGKEMSFKIDKCAGSKSIIDGKNKYDLIFVEVRSSNDLGAIAELNRDDGKCRCVIVSDNITLAKEGYKLKAFRFVEMRKLRSDVYEAIGAFCREYIGKSSANVEEYQLPNRTVPIEIVGMGLRKISTDQIIYAATYGRRVSIVTKRWTGYTYERLRDLENKLKKPGFFRCHNSILVNAAEIRELSPKSITMSDGVVLEVSRRKYSELCKIWDAHRWRRKKEN